MFGEATGDLLFNASRGIDETKLKTAQPSQSIGVSVNWGFRFTDIDRAREFLGKLACEVSQRLIDVRNA